MIKKRILFIDDEPFYHEVYGKPLKLAGFHVDFCLNGEKAAELIKTHSYSLVITDLIMPIMSGMRLLDKIRSGKKHIIVLTNLEGDTDREDALQAGVKMFLIKSHTTPKELVSIVKKVFQKQHAKT